MPPDLAHADDADDVRHLPLVVDHELLRLPPGADARTEARHAAQRGTKTRNWTQYNFQVLRDDIYMLGEDGSVVGGKIAPVRSSSAVVVSSQDLNRQWIYFQQQTVSSEGYAGQAFNTHVPHTVRPTETKNCTDCHLSAAGDNNAVDGAAADCRAPTSSTSWAGSSASAPGKGGVEAVAVTECDEPQAVIGSDLHKLAYPERVRRAREARDGA